MSDRDLEPRGAREHRGGTGHEGERGADEDGGPDRIDEPGRAGEQTEEHEEADLGEPGQGVGKPRGDLSVGQARVAEPHAGDIDGHQAARLRHTADPERQEEDGHRGQRIQAGGRKGAASEDPLADASHCEPDGHASRELVENRRADLQRVCRAPGVARHHGDQDDHGRVVEAGLRLEGGSQRGLMGSRRMIEKVAAASVEPTTAPSRRAVRRSTSSTT